MLWCVAAAVLGTRADADDVVQDAAAVALVRLGDFDPGTDFVAWMAQIVRYSALNRARLRQRRRTTTMDFSAASTIPARGAQAGAEESPVTVAGQIRPGQDSFDDRLLGALHELEETARSCLLLRSVLDLSFKQIAMILDIPEGTAMSHVHRARRRLRERLIECGYHAPDEPGREGIREAGGTGGARVSGGTA